MDASTFHPNDEKPIASHVRAQPLIEFHHLAGGIRANPDQRWYYYSMMTDTEVLVFHHFVKGKPGFINPHGSFTNPNCPTNYQSRMSVEMRAIVFFPKDKNNNNNNNNETETNSIRDQRKSAEDR